MERNDILTRAGECYDAAAEFRLRRQRYKRFTFGDQWADMVVCADGKIRSEKDMATMRGRTPLTNNMIRNLVKTVVGHFRHSLRSEQGSELTDEIDSRTLEEFLISGMAVQRVGCERRPMRSGVQVDHVNPARFFHSGFLDPRGLDVELVGMIHDWSVAETMARFAGGDRKRALEIRRLYGNSGAPVAMFGPATGGFARGASEGRCRVVEVWTLEASEMLRVHDPLDATFALRPQSYQVKVDALNRKRAKAKLPRVSTRWELTMRWHGRWLAPDGTVLGHTEADRHPFAFRCYPMVDGEVHSFVEDVIDQQKYINRLITHVDNMMSTSAKGVLLFPQDQLGDDLQWRDVADAWAAYDGIIPYNPRPGVPGPQQVITNPTPCGAYELLSLQMQMLEEVSGVSPALRGRTAGGGANSAQLYEAQVRYSSVALADLFDSFAAFRRERDGLIAAIGQEIKYEVSWLR